ncbi:MAG: hypothetical protein JWO57_3322 [Pseudonocardiales bacterium]|nr:hypothetical protein [Pseudonocardiales bacterium]
MSKLNYKTASVTAVFISAALLAAGCSSSKGGGANGGGAASSTTAPASASSSSVAAGGGAKPSASSSQGGAVAAGTAVTATEQEFSITLSAKAFKAGTYTFTVHNTGKFPHNLTIEGPGVDKQASPTLPGGGTGNVTVILQKGSYELWCSVDSHKDRGMDMTITVT